MIHEVPLIRENLVTCPSPLWSPGESFISQEAGMAKVSISFGGSTDVSQVKIDDVPVLLGVGKTSVELGGGEEHGIMWFVRGSPGSDYTVEITAPAEAKFTHAATIDGSTKDAGLHWFRVDGGGK
jgi:hypothetical protein